MSVKEKLLETGRTNLIQIKYNQWASRLAEVNFENNFLFPLQKENYMKIFPHCALTTGTSLGF